MSNIINDFEPQKENIEEQLLNFCRAGNYNQVVHLFDKYFDNPGFDINCRDYDGNTPLILAARQGHGSIIQELLRYVPDVSCENKKEITVIHFSTNIIQKKIFGSISSVSKYSDRLFCNACWLGNVEVVNRFLSKNQLKIGPHLTNLDRVNCYQLVMKNINQLESIAVNLKLPYKPAQVLQSLLNHTSSEFLDSSLLHIVARKICKSSTECAQVLLKKNFEIFTKDKSEFTPIHLAARSGNVAVLELLLSKLKIRANKSSIIDFQAKGGSTALHLAAMEGREECVRVLLNHGASPEITNLDNYSPVQLAKSVRVKNIFNSQSNPPPQKSSKLLPEIPFVLCRASTTVPQSGNHTRFSPLPISGKKSAEPIYCTSQSMSNPDIIDDFETSFSSSQKFPFPSTPLTKSAELPISSHENSFFRQKLTSQSVGLECLNEENLAESIDKQLEENDELFVTEKKNSENLVTINSNTMETSKNQIEIKQENDELFVTKKKKGENLANTKPKTTELPQTTIKKRIISNSGRTVQKNSKTLYKTSKSTKKSELGTREKSKIKNGGNGRVKGNGENHGEKKFSSQQNVSSPPANEIMNESDVTYESDFNSDNNSTSREEDPEFKLETNFQSDGEENDLNRTLTEKISARIHDHIEWKKGEQLGKGSYGTVWKGMLENGQYIAVKEILINEHRDEDGDKDGFSDDCIKTPREIRREIDILRTIRHKNIVKYIGACDSATCIHIFMEFVSGGSIAHILSKFGGLSENIIKIYMKQLVDAVAFLHNKSIIHRDLKGANIMVTPKGIIKVVDFGCAKKLEHITPSTASLTQQSRLQGSVYWLAPEVINGAQHTDRSDIWSIGCTGVEMITTRPPWSDLHPFAAMFAIGTGNKPFNVSQCATSNHSVLSSEICQFINLCLTRDEANRVTATKLLQSSFLK